MTRVVHDTFTDANGVLLVNHIGETGASWVGHESNTITSNRVYKPATTSPNFNFPDGASTTADQDVTVIAFRHSDTNSYIGGLARVSWDDPVARTGTHGYIGRWTDDGTLRYQLAIFQSGTFTLLSAVNAGWTLDTTRTIQLRCRDAAKELWAADGAGELALITSATDNTITIAGRLGLNLATTTAAKTTTGIHADEFIADDFAAVTSSRTVPQTARVSITDLARTVAQSARIQITDLARTVLQSARVLTTSARTVPQTATVSVTAGASRTIPQSAAVQTTTSRTVGQSARVATSTTRTVPQLAVVQTTHSRSVPQTAVISVANQERAVPQSARVATVDHARTVPHTARVSIVDAARTVAQTARVAILGLVRTVPQSARVAIQESRIVPQSARVQTTAARTVPQSATVSAVGTASRTVPQSARVAVSNIDRSVPQAARVSVANLTRTVPQTARVAIVYTRLVPQTATVTIPPIVYDPWPASVTTTLVSDAPAVAIGAVP